MQLKCPSDRTIYTRPPSMAMPHDNLGQGLGDMSSSSHAQALGQPESVTKRLFLPVVDLLRKNMACEFGDARTTILFFLQLHPSSGSLCQSNYRPGCFMCQIHAVPLNSLVFMQISASYCRHVFYRRVVIHSLLRRPYCACYRHSLHIPFSILSPKNPGCVSAAYSTATHQNCPRT
jgi:hypothetical protein